MNSYQSTRQQLNCCFVISRPSAFHIAGDVCEYFREQERRSGNPRPTAGSNALVDEGLVNKYVRCKRSRLF